MQAPEPARGAIPLLTPILRHRRVSGVLLALGIGLVGLRAAGIDSWICPLHALTGVPCPGCGLTRATVALLRGQLRAAWGLHPFAPLVLLFAALLVAATFLPAAARDKLIDAVEHLERRTRVAHVLAFALALFGAVRAAHYLYST